MGPGLQCQFPNSRIWPRRDGGDRFDIFGDWFADLRPNERGRRSTLRFCNDAFSAPFKEAFLLGPVQRQVACQRSRGEVGGDLSIGDGLDHTR